MDPDLLLADLLAGRTPALARAISVVENGRPGFERLLAGAHLGRARRIGMTGPPGAGKSTLVERLVAAYRAEGLKVGVVAVDPTSPFTGGALLGDRIRVGTGPTGSRIGARRGVEIIDPLREVRARVDHALVEPEPVELVAEVVMRRGVLAKDTHGSTIRLAPPIVISPEDLDFAVEQLKEVLEELRG